LTQNKNGYRTKENIDFHNHGGFPMLTQKQRDLLVLIHERMMGGQVAPSFDEMRDLLGLKSKSGIHRLITGLVERGYLARLPHRARALEVKKLPEGYVTGPADQSNVARQSAEIHQLRARTGTPPMPSPANASMATETSVPLLGKIAAGTPIEAIRDHGTYVDIPPSLLGRGDYYALTVSGDSMVDAGIHSGDTVLIRRSDTAENGRIIVALVDGAEVTLKRLRRKDGMIILQAENPAYEDRALPPDRVQIQGELAGLLRTYH
jgi:repressor LexA